MALGAVIEACPQYGKAEAPMPKRKLLTSLALANLIAVESGHVTRKAEPWPGKIRLWRLSILSIPSFHRTFDTIGKRVTRPEKLPHCVIPAPGPWPAAMTWQTVRNSCSRGLDSPTRVHILKIYRCYLTVALGCRYGTVRG
jgi:hypothetical protein